MAIDFSKVTDIKIPEGNVTKITDTNNTRTIWENNIYTLDFSHFVYVKTNGVRLLFVNNNTEDTAFLQKALKDTTIMGINYSGTAGVKVLFQNPTAGTYWYSVDLVYGTASDPYIDTYPFRINSGDFTLTSSSAYKSFTGHTEATNETRDEWRSLTNFWIILSISNESAVSWINMKYYTMLGSLKVRYKKSW